MRKKFFFVTLLLYSFLFTKAQSDTAFWFAAPDVDVVNNPTFGQYDRPIYLRMTSTSNPANVTVSIPANSAFTPINISIPANSTSTINLTPWIDLIENFEPSNINNKGIYIRSTSDITAYYEVNSITCHCNPELFSLKGKNAIGNEFYIPSQITWSIDTIRFPNAKAAFDIAATQNNTSITITPAKPLIGHPANLPFTIILNRGQSYSCQALYRNGPNLLNGSKIISDKPIAVTTKEDLLFTDGPCADLAGDQLIPTSIFGNEYAVVRGDLTVRDKVVITAKQNNTLVYLNGSGVSSATINAGQSYEVDITTQPSLYITTNNTVSVFHYTGNGCEVGGAVIPKLNCTGSSAVSIVRSNSGNAVVLLITKTINQGNFLVNGVPGIITAANFSPLAGTGGSYAFAKINLNSAMPLSTATTFSNTSGKFQLGFINGDPGGYMYGYFSDFKKSNVSTSQVEVCRFDSSQLNANGGVTYQWSPSTGLSNPNISNPKASPAVTTTYKVIITDIDGCTDSAFVKVIVNNCTLACNNWLSTPSQPSYINIGNLDVTGNKITIEATINRTQPYLSGTGNGNEGDIVSKHIDPSDVNYLLRPNHAYITTTNGFFATPDICGIELNKTYHVAMVYDGVTLKLYRNGYLMSQTPATGNLFQNLWPTRIGRYTGAIQETFLGYINEVRIWNIARTQAELQAYMNTSLPNPTAQPGLQAYYTFDNLLNKQGNAAFNGTIGGSASINATNPNCSFVADSCEMLVLPACNFWPKFNPNTYTTSIPGSNTMTFSFSNTSHLTAPAAYSTMTPGNWFTPNPTIATTSPPNTFAHNPSDLGAIGIYPVTTNETGSISFSSPPVHGFYLHVYQTISRIDFDKSFTLVSSDGDLHVGSGGSLTNNVLIPDVIQSQSPDDANATIYFPPGTSQVNFTLTSSPSSPAGDGISFAFTFPEDCITASTNNISGIINQYTPVLGLDICKNILTVADATNYNVGDTVLLIQMKGAVIDSANTASFGVITDYKNAGNYEFNYIKSKTGNNIELLNALTRNYDIPDGKVQLVRVPYYTNASVTATLTCLPWDGSKGGILVLNVKDSVNLQANIDVNGKGFRGGTNGNNLTNGISCFQPDYSYPSSSNFGAPKGEGIAMISNNKIKGRGALANGGGGGNDHNSGGGGGGNATFGGMGGYQFENCLNSPFDNRGNSGKSLLYSGSLNKVYLGGGGGSGHANNTAGFNPDGGNGGGIVMILTNAIKNNGFSISANGVNAVTCTSNANNTNCSEGMGGGGGGGGVLMKINTYIDNTVVSVKGGNGANVNFYDPAFPSIYRHGPGGGGSGGIVWLNQASVPGTISLNINGGNNGVNSFYGSSAWGATPGQNGQNLFNLSVPVDNTPFKKNIDSVRFNFSGGNCSSNNINFLGLAYVNGVPITTWQWYFGDGGTDNTQNTSHVYSTVGTYNVKLVATDNNGCKDSISKPVMVTNTSTFDFFYKQDVCNPLSVQFSGVGAPLVNPYWSFGDAGTSTGALSPAHTYAAPGNYLVRFTVNNACNDTISKLISINVTQADIVITPDTTICFGTTKLLRAQTSGDFCWSPATYLNNPTLNNPTTSAPTNITYYYTAEILGNNLIPNGDFSSGNTGFTSDYNYQTSNSVVNAVYGITTNAQTWNAGASPCLDHTSGTGNMLVANGATVPGKKLWKSSFSVTPNTSYQFSAWIQSISLANFAVFKFYINGVQFGPTLNAPSTACQWVQQKLNWNSGTNTTVDLSLEDFTYDANGNDFALDDISFNTVTIKRDSVKITVDTPKVTALGTTTVCAGVAAQLSATGSSVYVWSPATGLSNANIANPIATPLSSTTYTVTGTTVNGCVASDFVDITVLPKPVITKTPDTSICKNTSLQLLATGGTSYTWTPAATLSNANISNPIATPTAPVTKYYVTVTNNTVNTCSNRDSVQVTIRPDPVFTVSPVQAICKGTPAQLDASGGDIYLWSPAGLVSNAAIANPTTTAGATTNYSVTITESICNISQTLSTLVTVNPTPLITASKSNDIDCSIEFSNLSATGAVQYTWTPTTGLNNSSIANPVAHPVTTTQYVVKGSNAFGCYDSDTLTVAVTMLGRSLSLMPNTFTPNGDGKNDCFGIKYWGIIEQLEFAIYNRYGERVFYTTDPYQCWNGNYKSDKPLPGNYVYYIKAKTVCGTVERKGNVLLIR